MKPVAIPGTYGSTSPSNKAYKRSWREKITLVCCVSLKTEKTPGLRKSLRCGRRQGSSTAALRACSRVLDRDPRSGWNITYGSVPLPVFMNKD
jgi:hypothetical protein